MKHTLQALIVYMNMSVTVSIFIGTMLHENAIALADVFPISCQWKDISI
jgi:hypothetical protein